MDRLAELAELCEKASGPDRELDAAIAKAVGYDVEWATIGPDHRREELVQVRTYPGEAAPTSRNLLRYTASLDAAMSLVPEGWRPIIDLAAYEGETRVDLWNPIREKLPVRKYASAATPALALCAAALRARTNSNG